MRYAVFACINLALAFLLMIQTTTEGDMLLTQYHGLLYVTAILFGLAVINIWLFITQITESE